MSKALDYLKETGVFYLSTVNDGMPACRPFGFVCEIGDKLYLSTNKKNHVHKEIAANGNLQIVAFKPGTMQWMRLDGFGTEVTDLELKKKLMADNPQLGKFYHDDPANVLWNPIEVEVKSVKFFGE